MSPNFLEGVPAVGSNKSSNLDFFCIVLLLLQEDTFSKELSHAGRQKYILFSQPVHI